MAVELTVELENRPGTLAIVGEALGEQNVNIDGLELSICNNTGILKFVTNKPNEAEQALKDAGLAYTSREVLMVKLLDEPGKLADVAHVMKQAGINIDTVYITMKGMIVLGVDDLAGAEEVARGLDAM